MGAKWFRLIVPLHLKKLSGNIPDPNSFQFKQSFFLYVLLGSVLSGGGSAPLPKASAKDWIDMVNEFQWHIIDTSRDPYDL